MSAAHWPRVERPSRIRSFVALGTTVLLLLSVALNVALGRRLQAFMEPDDRSTPIGTAIPPLDVRAIDGHPVEIRFDGRPTILYYFSPNCGWCERNWTNVQALIASAGQRYRFVGLSTVAEVSPYMASHHLSFEVYSGLTLETARLYHLGGTPQTIVVAADGRIQYSWSGAYRSRRQHEVERAFGVVLPGIADVVAH
jgi:peroxiredoxin